MKLKSFLLFIWILSIHSAMAQGVRVGDGSGNPDQSAILDAVSTEKGFLPPRMTTEQRNAIVNPAPGLQVFNITTYCLNIWNGSQWRELCGECTPPAPNALSYDDNGPLIYCVNQPVSSNSPSTSGGSPTSYSVSPPLPSGLSLHTSTGIISGTPDVVSGPDDYTVTASNDCGNTQRVLNIEIAGGPDQPSEGSHSATFDEIVWHWNSVSGASGYKWNISDDYGTATDLGNVTTVTQSGLACNTEHTIYLWAYNSCNASLSVELSHNTASCPWTRIFHSGGDISASGTVSTSGYTDVLVFGIAPGGSGGRAGDDDGGGGGGSGAAQLSGYKIALNGLQNLYYSLPYPNEITSHSASGQYPPNLQLRENDSNGSVIFELNSGQNGFAYPGNQSSALPGGSGGASSIFSSTGGSSGGTGSTRNNNQSGSVGSNSSQGAAGGGGGGAWLGPVNGLSGGSSTASVAISQFESIPLNIPFTAGGTTGAATSQDVPTATGGGDTSGTTGGGAGGGIQFFGSGNYYGAGGGGGSGYGGSNGNGGRGGAAYVVIYAK